MIATLKLHGSATAGGMLRVRGSWLAPGPLGEFDVTGRLGGRAVRPTRT